MMETGVGEVHSLTLTHPAASSTGVIHAILHLGDVPRKVECVAVRLHSWPVAVLHSRRIQP